MPHSFVRSSAFLIAAAAVLACTTREESPKVPLGQATVGDSVRAATAAHALIGPAAKAALDSGNAYFRRKAYAEALAEYRTASTLAPQHAAPFFGIYMVARATNNVAMADSALADIRTRNGPLAPVPHTVNDSVLGRMHEGLRKKAATS
ncbi:MAG: hypothetical protein ABI625_13300 [bacterium]